MKFSKMSQYILFGGGELLCLTARQLLSKSIPTLVVTSQRHSIEMITIGDEHMPLIDFLAKYKIEYIISKKLVQDSRIISRISENTIGISFGAAWIFNKDFIDRFDGRLLNCHGTRLPQDRGAGGFSWRILRNDRIGISMIHQIDPGLDTGNVVLFDEYIFASSCKYPIDFQAYATEKYMELLDHFFNLIEREETFVCHNQQEYLSSYWPRLATDIHGYIDWSWDLKDIERFICAFDDPYIGASTFYNGNRIRLKKCSYSINDGVFHPFQKGLIYRISKDVIFVATEHGTLLIENVLNELGIDIKQDMKIGERLYTPQKNLEEAKLHRAIYTQEGQKI
jgi:methionyl-tRNA formyltransferase